MYPIYNILVRNLLLKKATESLRFSNVEIKILDNGFVRSVYSKQSSKGLILSLAGVADVVCRASISNVGIKNKGSAGYAAFTHRLLV